jgi:hypothetical protein
MDITRKDIDKRIWEEEIESWLPARLFDMHTHIYRPQDCLLKPDDTDFPRTAWVDEMGIVDLKYVRDVDEVLLPGRQTEYLLVAAPWPRTDWDGQAQFMSDQAAGEKLTRAEMPLHPSMKPEWVADAADRLGLVGMKPYRTMTADPVNCRITDMVPEPILEVANEKGLVITMHMAKERALADPQNTEDLRRMSARYPKVQWILAHCARCFAPWAMEKSIDLVADLPNMWIDISAVCSSAVFDILLRRFPAQRIMYGSDGFAGWMRGKYIYWGYTWDWMKEGAMSTSHASSESTFVLYEELRALGHSLRYAEWDKQQIDALFWDNAVRLLHGK